MSTSATSLQYFAKLYRIIKEKGYPEIQTDIPSPEALCPIHHDSSDILLNERFLGNWVRQMREGDVVYLNQFVEFMFSVGLESPARKVKGFVNRLVQRIPPGVIIVISESSPVAWASMSDIYPDGLAEHLLSTGRFADIADRLFGDQRARLDRINQVPELTRFGVSTYRVANRDEDGFNLDYYPGGRLRILQKVRSTSTRPPHPREGQLRTAV